MAKPYTRRPILRTLERLWTGADRLLNRVTTPVTAAGERLRPFNPLYHLGTLAIFLLIVLTVTGLYLVVFYRPGTERAYETVAGISANWLGSLMRSAHRYASDALIVVTLLHALKMLVADRFWGSRWLAWVSGWVMVAFFWALGVMGYWLVWDARAQWLTEFALKLLRGPFAAGFLGEDVAAATFSLFVIVLFLHVFLPLLIVLGIVIHVLRLTRVRLWAPRWLMVETGLVLVILSLLAPARSLVEADMGRIVAGASLDWWYLGFLPLISRLGNPLFWGLSLVVGGLVLSLPWLARGERPAGPAVILNPSCSGCALCARECPFEAIQMLPRSDETRFKQVARIQEDLCTGCGICVGTCSTSGVELDAFHSAVLHEDVQRGLERARRQGLAPTVVFTCERHTELGTLPSPAAPDVVAERPTSLPLLAAAARPRVELIADREQPLLTCSLPCAGMVHPGWAQAAVAGGAAGVVLLTCPADDCSYREGPQWLYNRVRRRRTLREQNATLLELAPGAGRDLAAALTRPADEEEDALALSRPARELGVTGWLNMARYLVPGLLLLLATMLLGLFAEQPGSAALPADGLLRLVTHHDGKLLATAETLPEDVRDKVPPGVDPAQVLGGERFPVQIRVAVDGETRLEESYEPRGLRNEGAVYGLSDLWLAPGAHQVTVSLQDDGGEWRTVFADTVVVEAGEAVNLRYRQRSDQYTAVDSGD